MYVKRNNEASSCNHCCCGKPVRITCSECVFATLGIQYAIHVHLPGSTKFSTLSHKDTIFEGKKLLTKQCVFLFSQQLLPETFSI
jgi:Fe-S-cluster containining protein